MPRLSTTRGRAGRCPSPNFAGRGAGQGGAPASFGRPPSSGVARPSGGRLSRSEWPAAPCSAAEFCVWSCLEVVLERSRTWTYHEHIRGSRLLHSRSPSIAECNKAAPCNGTNLLLCMNMHKHRRVKHALQFGKIPPMICDEINCAGERHSRSLNRNSRAVHLLCVMIFSILTPLKCLDRDSRKLEVRSAQYYAVY
jgi:hypothetical protein